MTTCSRVGEGKRLTFRVTKLDFTRKRENHRIELNDSFLSKKSKAAQLLYEATDSYENNTKNCEVKSNKILSSSYNYEYERKQLKCSSNAPACLVELLLHLVCQNSIKFDCRLIFQRVSLCCMMTTIRKSRKNIFSVSSARCTYNRRRSIRKDQQKYK